MKIALLNLPVDNNYGGNLQRYALMKVLEGMGHDVTHINLRFNYNPGSFIYKVLRACKRIVWKLFINKSVRLFKEQSWQKCYEKSCEMTDMFYYHYIKHTAVIGYKSKLAKMKGYDEYWVGSDQVWRKEIAKIYGINTFFYDFLPENVKAKRIAYGVSLGTDVNELVAEDLDNLTPLYNKFSAVSVREDSALDLFEQYGWLKPRAKQVLDPTLLLTKDDYIRLIFDGTTNPSKGNMFCYILDPSEEKDELILSYERKKNLKSFYGGIGSKAQMPVQQWLRSFYESNFIVTDSYHGMVFAIIFNKPFKLIYNPFRGNARFESLMRLLSIPNDTETIDWILTNKLLDEWRLKSISFIKESLVEQ